MGLVDFKALFSRFFRKKTNPSAFSAADILWHGWSPETEKLIAERNRPVLLFVANSDGTVFPFLREVFRAMPRNAKLRELLNHYYYGLFIEEPQLPDDFKSLGAGSSYNIAILSPAGFTPMAVINPRDGKPGEIVETIAKVLEKLKDIY